MTVTGTFIMHGYFEVLTGSEMLALVEERRPRDSGASRVTIVMKVASFECFDLESLVQTFWWDVFALIEGVKTLSW